MNDDLVPRKERGLRSAARFLVPGETVVLATNKHWITLAEPVATTVLSLILVVWMSAVNGTESVGSLLWWAWFVVLGRTLWRIFEWKREWFVATDKRFLKITGTLVRSVAMMPLSKITDIKYQRSVPGTVLGYGDFRMETPGQDQAFDRIYPVPRPDEAYRAIMVYSLGGKLSGPRAPRVTAQEASEAAPGAEPNGPAQAAPAPTALDYVNSDSRRSASGPSSDDGPATLSMNLDASHGRPRRGGRHSERGNGPETEPFEIPANWKKTTDEDPHRHKPKSTFTGTHPIGSGRRGEFDDSLQPGTGPLLELKGRRGKRGQRWKRRRNY